MKMSDKVYNILKFVAQVLLPAAATLYFAVAQIWHLPKTEEVVGTATAIDTFLGVLLGISSSAYNKTAPVVGSLIPEESDGRTVYNLKVEKMFLDDLAHQNYVTFKVESS